LRGDGERVFRLSDDDNRSAVLVVRPAAEHPLPSSLDRLTPNTASKMSRRRLGHAAAEPCARGRSNIWNQMVGLSTKEEARA
jgi:hypothetical protein